MNATPWSSMNYCITNYTSSLSVPSQCNNRLVVNQWWRWLERQWQPSQSIKWREGKWLKLPHQHLSSSISLSEAERKRSYFLDSCLGIQSTWSTSPQSHLHFNGLWTLLPLEKWRSAGNKGKNAWRRKVVIAASSTPSYVLGATGGQLRMPSSRSLSPGMAPETGTWSLRSL